MHVRFDAFAFYLLSCSRLVEGPSQESWHLSNVFVLSNIFMFTLGRIVPPFVVLSSVIRTILASGSSLLSTMVTERGRRK